MGNADIRGLFFDLYGTLFIPEKLERPDFIFSSLSAFFQKHNADIDGWADLYPQIPLPEQFRTETLSRFECRLLEHCRVAGCIAEEAELHLLADTICEQWQATMHLDPEVFPLFEKIREHGLSLRLITNYDHPSHVRRTLDANKLTRFFDRILISGEEEVDKPDPEILRRSIADTQLTAGQVVYAGDSYVDYLAARDAGFIPVLIRRPALMVDSEEFREKDREIEELSASGELLVISSLSELNRFLN